MIIGFEKHHGAGNDFIMIDARALNEKIFTTKIVNYLCDRHLGIGSDGLILLLNDISNDFSMKYFNADGKEGTMCGNGGRCISFFANRLGIIKNKANFKGIDGDHSAILNKNGSISLKMSDVKNIRKFNDGFLVETGSRHFVKFVDQVEKINVSDTGRSLRYESRFGAKGTNVNFVQLTDINKLLIRTFERGVEAETLACGTGTVAAAISSYIEFPTDKTSYQIKAPGGELSVSFKEEGKEFFYDIWLTGPVKYVFSGEIEI
jgi:diaminopimelate epimerase